MSDSPDGIKKVEKKRKKIKLNTVERLGSGAFAGAVGKSAVAPFQRIQIMFQVRPGEKLSLAKGMEVTKNVMQNEGVMALWRGNIANAGRSAPTAAIKFWSQSAYYNLYTNNPVYVLENSQAQFLSGACAGVTTVSATYPLDLFRTKLAANSEYKGYMDCTRKTIQAYGVRGLFHGLSAPLVGSIPHTGIAFWSYDLLKTTFGVNSDDPTKQSPLKRATAGFLAGFAGQTVTYPFSTVRRRMQTSGEWQQKGLIRCFTHTVQTEGFLGLFRAYSIHAFKGPLSAGISFAVNDIAKNFLTNWHLEKLTEEERSEYVGGAVKQA